MSTELISISNCNSPCDDCDAKEASPLCSVESARERIRRERNVVRFKAKEIIFQQGSVPAGLYTIQSGLVKIESLSAAGVSHTLRLLGPGDVIGYRALFSKEAYQGRAVAIEDVVACFVSKAVILDTLEKNPTVAMSFLSHISQDLRQAEEKWVHQVEREAPGRIAEAVIFLDENFAKQAWTRKEIAEWAGTTPETVMRVLAQFKKDGLLEAEGRGLKIVDRENLIKKSLGT